MSHATDYDWMNYQPRRALVETTLADDLETLAKQWDQLAQQCGDSLIGHVHRTSAAQVRNVIRRHQ